MINVKEGVQVIGLKMAMQKPVQLYELLCLSHGIEPWLTDAVADRGERSLHPLGYAVDLRMKSFKNPKAASKCLAEALGDDYDVIFYPDTKHCHIEYQKFLDMSQPYEPKVN